ncbi:hypothetical protein [Bacillus cereus]|uniref:hypothetical protein n=1 Tax=Bacillus cereus TaxID=1396 RepID=UPI000BED804C|nr:hypothetical protein [Bacillus cereus]PDY82783.1 hypothetical protein CON06_10290 [Bacillus cereus]
MKLVYHYSIEEIFNLYLERMGKEIGSDTYTFTHSYEYDHLGMFSCITIYQSLKSTGIPVIFDELDVLTVNGEIWSIFEVIDEEIRESILLADDDRIVMTVGYEEITKKLQGDTDLDKDRYEKIVRALKSLRLQQVFE